MENPTEFDLNRQILAWRENLGQSPAIDGENLSELEAHLRDSIATLQTRGLSASEAFLVATRRVGSDDTLAAEFGKVNRQAVWYRRILWMLVGLQLWGFVNALTTTLTRPISTLVLVKWFGSQWLEGDSSGHVVVGTSISFFVQLLALAVGFAICWWLVVNQWQGFSRWTHRLAHGHRLIILASLLLVLLLASIALKFEVISWLDMILWKSLSPEIYSKALYSQKWGFLAVVVSEPVLLLITTLWLARRLISFNPDFAGLAIPGGHNDNIRRLSGPNVSPEMSALVAELNFAGLSISESFMVAQHRSNGKPPQAFSSGPGHRRAAGWERAFWMLVGLQLCGLIGSNLWMVTRWATDSAMPLASHLLNPNQSSPGFNDAIPVAAFGLAQILSLGGTLSLCWWLTFSRGPQIAAWCNLLWKCRYWLAGAGVGVMLLLAETGPRLWSVFHPPLIFGPHAPAFPVKYYVSSILVSDLGQSAILLFLTLILARKQFKFGRTAGVR